MDLKIKDIVDLLKVSEKTVYQWIKDNKIPAYKINHQYRFNKSEIHDWLLQNKVAVSQKILDMNLTSKPVLLPDLIQKGGIFDNLEGDSIEAVIRNAVELIPLPADVRRKEVLEFLLERERMAPTAIGRGVAFPHPRNPIITDSNNECIVLCHPIKDINYNALDAQPIHTLFILLSCTPQRHLQILAKLCFLCQQESFILLLKSRAPQLEIMNYIANKEAEWAKRLN